MKFRVMKSSRVEGSIYYKIQRDVDGSWVDWECVRKEKDLPTIPNKPKVVDPQQSPDLWIKPHTGSPVATVPLYKAQSKAENQVAYLISKAKESTLKRQLEGGDESLVSWRVTGFEMEYSADEEEEQQQQNED